MVKGKGERGPGPSTSRLLYGFAVAFIVAVGVFVRAYRLGEQSGWYDDWIFVTGLGAPNLKAYLAPLRFQAADHTPIYPLVLYLYSRLAGPSLLAARILSIAFGVAAIIPLYWCGRDLFGRRAGLVAGLCLALSPLHAWLSQNARCDSLAVLLAALSVYAFLRMILGGSRRWWVAAAVFNLLLFYTYPLGLLLGFTQAIYLVVTAFPRRVRQTVVWGAGQFVCLLPLLPWFWQTQPYTVSYEEDYYDYSLQTITVDLLADDAISLSQAWMYTEGSNPYITRSPYSWSAFTEGYGLFNLGLTLCFVLCLAVCLGYGLLCLWRGARGPDRGAPWRQAGGVFYLVLLVFVPVLTLVGLALFFRPVLMARYTSFSSLGLYLMTGAAVSWLPYRWLRAAGVSVVIALYGYQLAIMLPFSTRVDWLGAARHIEENVAPGDLVFVRGRFFDTEAFRLSTTASCPPVLCAYTLQGLCEKSQCYLTSSGAGDSRRVWAVIQLAFDYPPLPTDRLEEGFASRGLRFTRTDFTGMGGVALYLITADGSHSLPPEKPCDVILDYDYEELLTSLDALPADIDERAAAVAQLSRVIEYDWPRGPNSYAQFSTALSDEGVTELAIAAAEKAISLRPESSYGHFALALACGESGNVAGVSAACTKMVELDRISFFQIYMPAFEALYVHPDEARAREEVEWLDRIGAFVPQAFRARIGVPAAARELRFQCP